MKISTAFILLFAITVWSCNKKDQNQQSAQNHTTKSDSANKNSAGAKIQSTALQLQKFGFPLEVNGCSCYFAENKTDFDAQKYLYIDDYGNTAYIKINNEQIKFPMEEGDFDPSNFEKKLENNDYQLYMKGKKISELDETMMFSGEITVTNKKTGEKTQNTFYGECGC